MHRSTAGGCCLLASVLVVTALATMAAAELPEPIQPLPPIEADFGSAPVAAGGDPAFRLASDPPAYRTPEDVLATEVPPLPGPQLSEYKKSFFQKLSFTATEVLRDGDGGLGQFETELFAAFAVPAPTVEWPLLLSPTLEVTFLDGPDAVALPPRLYAAYLDLMWVPRLSERWLGILAVAPGWYSDFEGSADDAFRLTGRALVRYDWQPGRLQIVLGAVYVNRMDSPWIPAAGVIWKPNQDWNLELVFPRAKLARRIGWGLDYEHWVYLGGSFGGNDWSIQRPGNPAGPRDTLALRDWRLTLGWERKLDGGAGLAVELGYVFSRQYELASTGIEYDLDDTLLVRGIVAY